MEIWRAQNIVVALPSVLLAADRVLSCATDRMLAVIVDWTTPTTPQQ